MRCKARGRVRSKALIFLPLSVYVALAHLTTPTKLHNRYQLRIYLLQDSFETEFLLEAEDTRREKFLNFFQAGN